MIRAGSRALSFFAHPLNARILRAHEEEPLRPAQLEQALGWASPSSLRLAVGNMCELGTLHKVAVDGSAPIATTELTAAGRELLPVAGTVERWLRHAPDGPVGIEDPAAQGILKVLTAGWDSTMLRALAERPLTLNELSAGIPYLSYPTLKRRLAKLRATRLVIPVGSGREATYAATDWLRRAVVPLAVGGRWELLHDPGAEPITAVEVEAAFLLTLPLVELSARASGECTFAVLVSDREPAEKPRLAGVAVEVKRGKIVSCSAKASSAPATWAMGTVEAWLEAVIEGRGDVLRIGGAKPRLAKDIVKGVNEALFRG